MDSQQELLIAVNNELQLSLNASSRESLVTELAAFINDLINKDFQKLVFLLYRVDVNEHKLKRILKENEGVNAGNTIAQLIIERELQKINSRKQFQQGDISEEEKW